MSPSPDRRGRVGPAAAGVRGDPGYREGMSQQRALDAFLAGAPASGLARTWTAPRIARAPRATPSPESDAAAVLRDIANGVIKGSPAQVRAALAVLELAKTARGPATEEPAPDAFDPTTPEGEAELMRDLIALPSRLLLAALERQGVAPMAEARAAVRSA